MRASGKNLELWLAPDDSTTPLVTHKVAYVRTQGFQGSRPITDVSAATDARQSKVGGLAGATVQVSGVSDLATPGGGLQMWQAFLDGLGRNFRMLPQNDQTGDYIEGTAIVQSLSHNGDFAGTWQFSATLQLTGAFNAVAA